MSSTASDIQRMETARRPRPAKRVMSALQGPSRFARPIGRGTINRQSSQAANRLLHRPCPTRSIASSKAASCPATAWGISKLVEYVGGGGMGRVFRAIDTQLGRTVALKILTPDQATDPDALQRFQNEAQSSARLDHDNIARAYYQGEDTRFVLYRFRICRGREHTRFDRAKRAVAPGRGGQLYAASGRSVGPRRRPAPWSIATSSRRTC